MRPIGRSARCAHGSTLFSILMTYRITRPRSICVSANKGSDDVLLCAFKTVGGLLLGMNMPIGRRQSRDSSEVLDVVAVDGASPIRVRLLPLRLQLQPAPVGCMSSAAVDAVGVTFKAVTGSGCTARTHAWRTSPWEHPRLCAGPSASRRAGALARSSRNLSSLVCALHLGRSGFNVGVPRAGCLAAIK